RSNTWTARRRSSAASARSRPRSPRPPGWPSGPRAASSTSASPARRSFRRPRSSSAPSPSTPTSSTRRRCSRGSPASVRIRGSWTRPALRCRPPTCCRSGPAAAWGAGRIATSRRWRVSAFCARPPSPVSRPSSSEPCRTPSPSATARGGGSRKRSACWPWSCPFSSTRSRLTLRELPPPLPPGERTVGQLVAESIRFYGEHFWRAVPLGIPLALADQLSVHHSVGAQAVVFWALTPLFVAAYVYACTLVHGGRATATVVGVALLIYLPFPALRALYLLPAVAWFAFIGLAVPA